MSPAEQEAHLSALRAAIRRLTAGVRDYRAELAELRGRVDRLESKENRVPAPAASAEYSSGRQAGSFT